MIRPVLYALLVLPVLLGSGSSGPGTSFPAAGDGMTSTSISLRIDRSYAKIWSEKGITPSPLSTDEEFVRRAYLDITGRIPTAQQAESFLNSTAPDKRERLLATLVDSPEFAEYFASLWTALFLGYKNDPLVNRIQFQEWMQEQLYADRGWNEIASEMIMASGNLADSPALNWFGRHRLDAASLADDTSRLFLGIQLGCARCHNHPYEKWKLDDFYGLAAFYGGLKKDDLTRTERMQRRLLKQKRDEIKEKYGKEETALRKEPGIVKQMRQDFRSLVRLAETPVSSISVEIKGKNETYPAKFLMEPEPAHITDNQRRQLANWITSPENPFFAHAFANRIWGLLMGKGFVHPVDDMGTSREASNPQLLQELAEDFKKHGYSAKHLVYSIANTRIYQLSSASKLPDAPEYYERAKVQMLNPDQFVNSFLTSTSVETALRLMSSREFEQRKQMMYLYHVHLFDNDDTKPAVEFEGTIAQALFLLNGRLTNEAVQPLPENTTTRILERKKLDIDEKIDLLFLHALSRHATPQEIARLRKNVWGSDDVESFEDIFWALLNSSEFLFNH